MTNILRSMRKPIFTSALVSVMVVGLAGCNMDVVNPSVIDASKFNPNADGQTLSLSAQTNFFMAFQSVALYGGFVSEELWSGQTRFQQRNLAARTFAASDDINSSFFAPLSLAIASNENAVAALASGAGAASDVNLARSSMNLGFSLELMAETMCAGVIQGGPSLTDAQLLDTAVARFTTAVTVATAAGSAGAAIVNQSNVGLARAYLQQGNYAKAAATAALVPSSFVTNVVTSSNVSTQGTLGNQIYGLTVLNDVIVPKRYRIGDPRMQSDSTVPGKTQNGVALVIQSKFKGYADPIRLASGLEAQYISAEAALHGSNNTAPAISLINARRSAGAQGPYAGGSDSTSVIAELLNQSARDFWMEGKKLGDLRRNPSVSLPAVLTDPAGAPFYASPPAQFGSNFCAPIPPQETNTNPNFTS
ncbi:MAG TPA: hypothetical protein VLI40_00025 [Gemmatimonadaceae bacterium]|nr:hypothetical protein [Gemmatimonadaceae bacterium]